MRRATNIWRRLPVATKVPLSLGVLLLLVLVGMSLLAWVEVRRSAEEAAVQRMRAAGQQLADLVTAGWAQRFAIIQTAAANPAFDAYLRDPSAPNEARARDSLVAYEARAGNVTAAELWDAEGARRLAAGETLPPFPEPAGARVRALLAPPTPATVGPFALVADTLEYLFAAAVGGVTDRVGTLVERRRVTGSAATAAAIQELIGRDARMLVGNRLGDVWTDFTRPVPAPPVTFGDTALAVRYVRDGVDVFAHAVPVPDSPWSIVIEFPAGPVLAPASRFLTRTLIFSVVLAAIGATVGSVLTRRVTDTLTRVTQGAEAITHGRATELVQSERADEIGRLAGSFNEMAREVQEKRQRLQDLVDRYRLLFDANPMPMWLFDAETLAVLDVNEAAVRHYGWSREEFKQMTLADIRSPEEAERLRRHLRGSDAGLADAGIWQHRRKDGSVIDVEVTRHVMTLDGRRVVLSLANDVTARVRAERAQRESAEELRRLNAELEARVQERTAALQASNQELEAFSYSVSHDLRAPLRAIDGFSRILMEDHASELTDQARHSLDVIARNARHMGQLIDDLLAFSRLSRQPLSLGPVDMSTLARQVADTVSRDAGDRPIELVVGDLPTVRGEHALLRQVWTNYLQNAVKFTRGRTPARIEVGHQVDNGELIFFVRDNGAGFDMRYGDKLFGVFQRLHRPEEFEGTGVGLAIVKRIVLRHGGRVWAEGAEERGATFYFTLPAGASE